MTPVDAPPVFMKQEQGQSGLLQVSLFKVLTESFKMRARSRQIFPCVFPIVLKSCRIERVP
jgi:hypothetical protein